MSRISRTVLDPASGVAFLTGDVDPTAAGLVAEVGSVYTRRTTGQLYRRTTTGWQETAGSGAGQTVAWGDITGVPANVTNAITQSFADGRYILQGTGVAWSAVSGAPDFARRDTGNTFSATQVFPQADGVNVGGIRGLFAAGSDGYGLHLWSNVDVGFPGGWGGGLSNTPTRGLSTWGAVRVAYGNQATSRFDGQVQIVRAGEALRLAEVGSPSHAFISWWDNNVTRKAYVGFPGDGATSLDFANETGGGHSFIVGATSRARVSALGFSTNAVLDMTNTPMLRRDGIYNTLHDPTGRIALYAGDANDAGNYYDNTRHVFRNRAGTVDLAGVNTSEPFFRSSMGRMRLFHTSSTGNEGVWLSTGDTHFMGRTGDFAGFWMNGWRFLVSEFAASLAVPLTVAGGLVVNGPISTNGVNVALLQVGSTPPSGSAPNNTLYVQT